MRPALLLLVFLAMVSLPARSQATQPNAILLGCDTVSVSPLQVHFQFAVQNPPNNIVIVSMSLCPTSPGTHILSCSPAPGTSCASSPYLCPSTGVIWNMPSGLFGGQTLGPFDFVTDQSPACFNTYYEDPLLGMSAPSRPDNYTWVGLCFSCTGIEATPTQTSTWGSVKATYR